MSDTGSTHLRLEVISGNAAGNTILVEDELVIGRHAAGAGRLSEDEEISRQHARISREVTGDYAIEDLGSSNGTFVNGLRIQSPRLLTLGDSIEAGTTTLVVREIARPQPAEPAGRTVLARAPVDPAGRTMFAPVPVEPAAQARAPVDPAGQAAMPAEPPSQVPPLALRLDVDFDAREARIALGDGGETVRMVFEDGRWRASPAGSDPDG